MRATPWPISCAVISALPTYILLKNKKIRGDTTVAFTFLAFALLSSVFYLARHDVFYSVSGAALFLASHIITVACTTICYRLSPFHPLASFPGPTINKITCLKLAQIVYSGKRHLVIRGLHEKYGLFVRTAPNTLSINLHAAVKTIYASSQCLDKSDAYRPGRFDQGGLFFIRGREEHNHRRRIWAGAFSASSIKDAVTIIAKRTKQLIDCVDARRAADGSTDLTLCIQHWSYDVMGELTFGGSSRLELMQDGDNGGLVASGQKATVAFEILGEIPALFDIMWYLPATKDLHDLEKLASELLSIRRQSKGETADLCSYLLEGSPDTGSLSETDLNLDSLFAIQAGSDTTSSVLILLFYHILSNRRIYDKLTEELDLNFPNKDIDYSHQDLMKLPYLNAVVNESLRLGTPFPGLPRVVPRGGIVLEGYAIPEGTIIGVPAYTQQVSPDNFWPQPMEFLPERWLPGGLGPDSILNRSAIMCFSYGPFGCLGKALAIHELHIVTAELLLAYTFTFASSFSHEKFRDGVLNMRTTIFKYPLHVEAAPRKR